MHCSPTSEAFSCLCFANQPSRVYSVKDPVLLIDGCKSALVPEITVDLGSATRIREEAQPDAREPQQRPLRQIEPRGRRPCGRSGRFRRRRRRQRSNWPRGKRGRTDVDLDSADFVFGAAKQYFRSNGPISATASRHGDFDGGGVTSSSQPHRRWNSKSGRVLARVLVLLQQV